jgi:hypothetical protein
MASSIEVHQALFGYDRGHRLLAASTGFDPEVRRELTTLSDASFEADHGALLLGKRINDSSIYALIKTWPAPEQPRPGSVWSHALIIDVADYGRITDFSPVARSFKRPSNVIDSNHLVDQDSYSQPLRIEIGDLPKGVDVSSAAGIVAAVYSTDNPRVVVAPLDDELERLMFSMLSQQWPRLRRHFSFRFRARPSDQPVSPFDVEFVQKGKSDARPIAAQWPTALAHDLRYPDLRFRTYLRTFGAESQRPRSDMASLTEIYRLVGGVGDDLIPVGDSLVQSFPGVNEMTTLKRALLGEASDAVGLRAPFKEADRLHFVLINSAFFSFTDLQVGRRLATLIKDRSSQLPEVLDAVDFEQMSTEQIEELIGSIVSEVSPERIAASASSSADLLLMLVARSPRLLSQSAVWDSVDPELLINVFDRQTVDVQAGILRSLLSVTAVSALVALCAADPGRWWRLLSDAVTTGNQDIFGKARLLRDILDQIGAASLPPMPEGARRRPELTLLLLSAELSVGLWRRVHATSWIDLSRAMISDQHNSQDFLVERATSVALISSANADRSTRMKGWATTFPFLHTALRSSAFDDEAWRMLATTLPAADEWDRCRRLRKGVVRELRRDDWSPNSAATLIAGAGEFGDEISTELHDRASRKKKTGWLAEVLRMFS